MIKILFCLSFISILFSANAKETLYLNIPTSLPSQKINTLFGRELIKLIDTASKEIDFAIYGLRGQDAVLKALIKAKQRGVIIRGVVDSNTHGKNYYSDTKLLYRYFPIVSDHQSYIMHNKFFIIDKKIVWSGSSNISDTGTGGYNANDVIVINNKRVSLAYEEEFSQMFYEKRFHIHKYPHSVRNIVDDDNSVISIYFSPKSNTYQQAIKNLIKDAKKYIYIPIFYLTRRDLANDLIDAKDRGVDIKIILDATAARNRYSIHRYLRKSGIAVKVENFGGKMHVKAIIIDDKYIVGGSMNLTKAGNNKNDENTIVLKNPKMAKKFRDYFLKLWSSIPRKYLFKDPSAESWQSGNSCFDGIDNDFDHKIDLRDKRCRK